MSRNIYFIYLISYEKVNNLLEARRVPRSSSPVWLISEVKDVFVTVERSFKYM